MPAISETLRKDVGWQRGTVGVWGTEQNKRKSWMAVEQRKHIRLYLNCTVFVELEDEPANGEDPGEIALCKTLDVS